MMSSRLHALWLLLLLIPSASAQIIVLETQVTLLGNQVWEGSVTSVKGDMSVTISTTQGILNFTMIQANILLISIYVTPQNGSVTIDTVVDNALIKIHAASIGNFIPSTVSIKLEQEKNQIDGFYVGIGLILVLLLPSAYLLGRKHGRVARES